MVRLSAFIALAFALSGAAWSAGSEKPRSFSLPEKSFEAVDLRVLEPIDREQLMAEDRDRGKGGDHPGPDRFAVGEKVEFDLRNSGTWLALPDGRIWRLRIQSPGAVSQNLAIERLDLPEGAKLWIYGPDHEHFEGPYTAQHQNRRGGLWTPIINGDEIVIEVFVPSKISRPVVRIGQVNKAYHGFGHSHGACNNDVVCPEGNPWLNEIHSVALYTIGGTGSCSGQLMNNTAVDFTPYFLSANHCGVSAANDDTLVFYWNYQAANCGDHDANLALADTQTGATFRAASAPSDFVLVELDAPPAAANAYFSGWDATGAAPASTVGIHHPRTHVKSISFNTDPVTSTAYYSNTANASANHWRVDDWEDGTTEPGSSGSCLWDAATHRCVGQLHGGDASCAASTSPDWFGKFSVSWTGGGTNATRLSNWLDPVPTGALTLNGDPHITTLDGTHFNFQGAGEYVVLHHKGVAEVQARMAPIATTFDPGPDPYDDLATCVSLNSAVAARVGERRVSYQPRPGGAPDPRGLELRVDGELVNLGSAGIDLGNGGRINRTSAPGGLEIVFPERYVLRVTPGWWASQSTWYLNLGVERSAAAAVGGATPGETSFVGGIAGPIAPGSWLPALPNGASLGPMPTTLHDRYATLYDKFGDAWRVSATNSLFDYAPGRSTSDFTFATWPKEKPPCDLPDVEPVRPTSLEVAREACAPIRDQRVRADCVFDVQVTGETGFAQTYLLSETTTSSRDAGLHVECYEVDKSTQRLQDRVVALESRFGSRRTKLGRITRVCTPVSKNAEGIPDKAQPFVCYEILDRYDARRTVVINNQFGEAKLNVRNSQELCVPSTLRDRDK